MFSILGAIFSCPTCRQYSVEADFEINKKDLLWLSGLELQVTLPELETPVSSPCLVQRGG